MKKKSLTVQFRHETNVFCPAPADEQAFRNYRLLTGEEVLQKQRGFGTEFGAFLKQFDKREDIELIPTAALYACPCGPVTADVYDFVVKEITKAVREHGSFDGVLCDVH